MHGLESNLNLTKIGFLATSDKVLINLTLDYLVNKPFTLNLRSRKDLEVPYKPNQ